MVNLDIWKDHKHFSHATLDENELIEAIKLYLLANGYIDFNNTYEVEIGSITR